MSKPGLCFLALGLVLWGLLFFTEMQRKPLPKPIPPRNFTLCCTSTPTGYICTQTSTAIPEEK